MTFLTMCVLFLLNTVLAARNVSLRRYGWATLYALCALWSVAFAVQAHSEAVH